MVSRWPPRASQGGSWGSFGRSWRRLGGSGAALGGVLGRSWAVLWRSERDTWSSQIFDCFLDRLWSPKGCPKGGILGAKTVPKSMPKRGRNLRAKKLPLGSDLVRFGVVLGGSPEGIFMDFVFVFLLLCEHQRFGS